MKRKLQIILSTIALVLGLSLTLAPVASADIVDVFKGDACKGNTSVCDSKSNGLFTIIKNVINLLLYAAGIIAVIMIIIGGINYALSNGEAARIASAKNTVFYAIIGIVVAIMAFSIVNFVLTRVF